MSVPIATTAELSLKSRCKKYFGKKNLYEVLDIPTDASEKEICQAYRKLSLKVHPDRVGEDKKAEATEKFKVVNAVHSILSTKSKREQYDKRERESTGVLFEDTFNVKGIYPDAKQSDRVSRLHCESELFKMDLVLDVNTRLYPMELQNKFRLTLSLPPKIDSCPDSTPSRSDSCSDSHKYHVMFGTIYRVESLNTKEPKQLSACVSFKGLLMRIQGDPDNLRGFEVGKSIYLLMNKLAY